MGTFEKHNVADIYWQGPGSDMEVVNFHTTQALSELYMISAEIKSPEQGINFGDMINAEVSIVLKSGERLDVDRHFSGIITRFHQQRTKHGNLPNSTRKIFTYEVEIRPKFWLLTKRVNTKVFQEMTAKDIVDEVLGEHGIIKKWDIQGSPRQRDFCVQYRESDFNFVSRLLEDEGITYFFNQKDKELVFTDYSGGFPDCQPRPLIPYVEDSGNFFSSGAYELITDFEYQEEIGSGKFSVNHYNYETSQVKIDADKTHASLPALDALETYDPTWAYKDANEGRTYTATRMEEELSKIRSATGLSSARSFEAGNIMEMEGHFRDELNCKWLLTSVMISAEQGSYKCHFKAYPADEPYRPERKTRIPRVEGIQTAIVTGPSGAKVYLDKMGRCKLQFHWDRLGEVNDRSSMWVRVSNGYAGKDYGIQWIPRVGHEVLVDFINGDPDLPVVVGRVYNDFNTAPLGPVNKWQNIIKDIKDNHIIFDAKDGAEEVNVRAQKNMTTTVINNNSRSVGADESVSVGHDRSVSVGNNESREIGVNQEIKVGNNRDQTVGNNETITIGVNESLTIGNNYSETVGANKTVMVGGSESCQVGTTQTLTVGASRTVSVGAAESRNIGGPHSTHSATMALSADATLAISAGGSASISVGGAMTINAATLAINAASITLTGGSGSVSINPAGVTISGPMVTLTGIIKHNC